MTKLELLTEARKLDAEALLAEAMSECIEDGQEDQCLADRRRAQELRGQAEALRVQAAALG